MSPEPSATSADFKAVLFLNIPLHSIISSVNACAIRLPDENVATESCLHGARQRLGTLKFGYPVYLFKAPSAFEL
jgi:hypothetical protein